RTPHREIDARGILVNAVVLRRDRKRGSQQEGKGQEQRGRQEPGLHHGCLGHGTRNIVRYVRRRSHVSGWSKESPPAVALPSGKAKMIPVLRGLSSGRIQDERC